MRRLLDIPALAVVAVALGGCGTFANTCWLHDDEGGKRIYGGVCADAHVFRKSLAASLGSETPDALSREHHQKAALWSALDLPFSVVGDTLTLPYTIAATIERTRGESAATAGQGRAGPTLGAITRPAPADLP